MLVFGNVRPEQLGPVRVLRTYDMTGEEWDWQTLESAGHVLAMQAVPKVRRETADLLVRARSRGELVLNLARVRRWLLGSGTAPLSLWDSPGDFCLARCTDISKPEYRGLSAKISVTFVCQDWRHYQTGSGRANEGFAPESDGFTFAGQHVFRDMGCLFILERRTAVPVCRPYKLSIPGLPGTIRYEEVPELEERTAAGTLYLMRHPDEANGEVPLTYEETEARIRRLSRWLMGSGRADLVWDADQDTVWQAEVTAGADLERGGWQSGRMRLTFQIQPVGKGRTVSGSFTMNAPGTLNLGQLFPDGTGYLTPLNLTIRNMGTKAVTSLEILSPGTDQTLRFAGSGFSLGGGQTLRILSEERWAELNGQVANRFIAAGDFPFLPPGGMEIAITSVPTVPLSVTVEAEPAWI